MRWYFRALGKYAVFRGRASRKEFWMFALFSLIAYAALVSMMFADGCIAISACMVFYYSSIPLDHFWANVVYLLMPLTYILFLILYAAQYIYLIAMLLPSVAVTVRRLHDTGKPGCYIFTVFIPIYGIIWLIVMLCGMGDEGPNLYDGLPAAKPDDKPEAKKISREPAEARLPDAEDGNVVITSMELSKAKARTDETVHVEVAYRNEDAKPSRYGIAIYVNGLVVVKRLIAAPAKSSGSVAMPLPQFQYIGTYRIKAGEFIKILEIE
jgi:uncharacterized membrane protein YhaH (DUF805 family)